MKESPNLHSRHGIPSPWENQGRLEVPAPAPVVFRDEDLEGYLIRQGDRLDRLAYDLLGDSRWWWVIVDVNRELIPDTLNLPLGVEIKVPTLQALGRIQL